MPTWTNSVSRSAIETCRTTALGGYVEPCDDCGNWRIACNSCRSRAPSLACFYSATLAWNPTAVDRSLPASWS